MKEKKNILKRLDEIQFHDVPVKRISLNIAGVQSDEFAIDLSLYHEVTEDYGYFTLKFTDIKELKMDHLLLNGETQSEITSFDYQWEDSFEATIVFSMGFGQPSFVIELKREGVAVVETGVA